MRRRRMGTVGVSATTQTTAPKCLRMSRTSKFRTVVVRVMKPMVNLCARRGSKQKTWCEIGALWARCTSRDFVAGESCHKQRLRPASRVWMGATTVSQILPLLSCKVVTDLDQCQPRGGMVPPNVRKIRLFRYVRNSRPRTREKVRPFGQNFPEFLPMGKGSCRPPLIPGGCMPRDAALHP